MPDPERVTAWGLPVALSAIDTEAERLPVAAGVNVTLIEQPAPAMREEPQVVVWAKSPELTPVIKIPEILSVAFPLFVSETLLPGLVVFNV
jgi:hypothetical protein